MKHKYFIALIPPKPLFEEIEAIKKGVSLRFNNKSALRSPAHITLHMPFEFKTDKESQLIETLHQIKFEKPLHIQLKNYSFFEPKVVFIDVLENKMLNAFQAQLVNHLKVQHQIFNQANDLRKYHPHITIAFRDLKKSAFYEMKTEFENKKLTADFTTMSFYLLRLSSSQWEVIKEFSFIA